MNADFADKLAALKQDTGGRLAKFQQLKAIGKKEMLLLNQIGRGIFDYAIKGKGDGRFNSTLRVDIRGPQALIRTFCESRSGSRNACWPPHKSGKRKAKSKNGAFAQLTAQPDPDTLCFNEFTGNR